MGKKTNIDVTASINRITGKKDQFQQIVKETEAFYNKLESNPAEINIGDIKHAIVQLQQMRAEYNQINDDANSNHGAVEFANTLLEILSKAEEKFGDIGIMFKNVNNNTKKYVTGLSNITRYLSDSSFGVSFVDIGAQFGYLRNQAEELYGTLKSMNTVVFGRFNLDFASMDASELRDCLDVLQDMRYVVEQMTDVHPNVNTQDLVGNLTANDLSSAIEQAESDLEDLQRFSIATTEELRKRREIIREIEEGFTWDDDEHKEAKRNIHDDEVFDSAIENIQRYIKKRKEAIDQLRAHEDDLFAVDGIAQYEAKANAEIERLQGLMKELQDARNGKTDDKSVVQDFSEVITALNEIKTAIREIKDAFEPLTQAFANEDSAINKMVNANVEDLNRLQEKFEQVFQNIQTLSEKEFSNQTIIQQTTKGSSVLSTYKTEARSLLKIVSQLGKEAMAVGSRLTSTNKLGVTNSEWVSLSMMADDTDTKKIQSNIKSSKDTSDVIAVYEILTEQAEVLLSVINKINQAVPGSIDASALSKIKSLKDLEGLAGGKNFASKTDVSEALDQVETLKNRSVQEFDSLRAGLKEVFDFGYIDPNYEYIQGIVDKIYQQFEELQAKIKALDFKIEVPDISGLTAAVQVIEQEGKAAEGATPKKDAFTAANQKVSESMKETGDAGKVAADGVKSEAESVKKAYKTIADFSFRESDGVSDSDFEDFADQIAANKNLKVKQARATRGEMGNLIGGSITFYDPKTLQEIQERYSVRPKEDSEDELELYRASYTLIENTAKAEQKVANEAERRSKAIADSNKWLIEQEDLLNKQENKYKASSGAAKPLDGSTPLVNINAGVLPGIDKTIDGLANSIRTRIQDAMGGVVTQEAKNEIIKDLNTLANEIQVQQARTYQSTTLRASSLETSREVYKQYIDSLEADAKKSGVFDQMSGTIEKLKSEVESFTADNFVAFLENVKKAQAEFKSAKSKLGQQTQEQKQQEQVYNKLIQLQDKLYESKKKLAVQEYGSVGEQEWQRKVNEAQQEYNLGLQAIQNTEKKSEALRREAQLQSEVDRIVQDRIKKEEELAWIQREQADTSRIEQEIDAAYKERADAIKAETAAEKELIAAKKESDAFYQQEERTRRAQEDAAWAEYRAEQEAAAEKERQINLAFSQKAAQEAAEAERELAQARKEADEYFAAVEKQEKKEEEAKKVKELNALYRERNTIITAIIKYNNKAETLKTDKAIQRAKDQLELEKQRLAAIDGEIDKYGELVNLSKLEQQNDRLTSRLRDSNVTNFITKEQRQNIEDVNRLLERRKEVHDNILKLQKQLNDASGDAERKAIKQALDGQNAIYRALTKQLATYKDIALQRKVTEQDTKFNEQDAWNKAQKNIDDAANADKAAREDQKQDYKDILSLVEQLFDAQTALHKINTDPTDNVHTAEREKEIARVKELSMLLRDIYGIDIKNLTGSLDKNALLTQEQKNKLLEQERAYKQDIVDLTAKAADKAADLTRKEQQRANSEAQNYGKADLNRLNKFSESMHASIRELQSSGSVSATLNNLVAEFDAAYSKVEAMRKQFNEDPASMTQGMKTEFQDSVHHADNLRQRITDIFKESQKLQKIGSLITTGDKDVSKVENLKSEMIAFANSALAGEVKINGFNKEGSQMYVTLNQGAGAVENITVALDKASGHLQAFTTGTSKATNEWEDFKTQAVSGAKNLIGMYVGFQEGVQAVRKGIDYVKEIDLAMTELKKVTDETDAAYKQFLKDAGSTSAVIGSTISDFTEATATFARLGYSMEEASNMAETSIIYKNVADGLDSVEESSQSIISTMMAFGIEANDTMSIIDRFNAVGKYIAQDNYIG